MALPGYKEIMLPLLQFLKDGKEHFIREIYDNLARYSKLSDIGLSIESSFEIKKIDSDYFEEE